MGAWAHGDVREALQGAEDIEGGSEHVAMDLRKVRGRRGGKGRASRNVRDLSSPKELGRSFRRHFFI